METSAKSGVNVESVRSIKCIVKLCLSHIPNVSQIITGFYPSATNPVLALPNVFSHISIPYFRSENETTACYSKH